MCSLEEHGWREEGEAVVAARGVLGFAVTPLLCRRLAPGCWGQLWGLLLSMCVLLSDEADMERACMSYRALRGVPRRQNGSVVGLLLPEVRSCPGLQFCLQDRVWETTFSLRNSLSSQLSALGRCCPCCTFALHSPVWAVPLLWRCWVVPACRM